jgi:hypothetical protein
MKILSAYINLIINVVSNGADYSIHKMFFVRLLQEINRILKILSKIVNCFIQACAKT